MPEIVGTRDHIYPGLVEEVEDSAAQRAGELASDLPGPIVVRDTHPHLDFDVPSTPELAWTGDEPYFIQFSGQTDAGEYEVYEVDSDNGRSDDRVTVIYGFQAILGGDLLNTVRFESGDEMTFELVNLQGLDVTGDVPTDTQTLLRSPVEFGLQDNGSISFDIQELGSDDDLWVKLLSVTAEKTGRRVGVRT